MLELLLRSAGDLAALIRTGELSASELVGASLERIDALEPRVNAFAHVAHDAALAAAAQIRPGDERPFAGVPIAIKDNRPVAGMPLSIGSALFGDLVARRDTFLVRRLREAGFVIVGKTTLPEMGLLPTCESRRFGPTRNPWDLERTPGGSSGGSGAAVAAGMVPIAHGNDGGGSIRIPAACCGLVGLKPARNRVSVGPESGESFLVSDGVLTRTVADTASVLEVLAGYEPGDANWAPPLGRSARDPAAAGGEPGGLRIGVTVAMPAEGGELDPVCAAAVSDAAALLEGLGHSVEEFSPPWDGISLLADFTRLFAPMAAFTVYVGGRLAHREPAEADVEPLTWLLWERARAQDTIAFLAVTGRLEALARRIVAGLVGFDAVLTPALAQRPLRTGEVHGRGPDPWEHFQRSGLFTPYTALANITGLPAVSLPLYHGDDGLPVAVQLIGRPAGEAGLLSLAAQLEQSRPWADRVSPLAAGAGAGAG